MLSLEYSVSQGSKDKGRSALCKNLMSLWGELQPLSYAELASRPDILLAFPPFSLCDSALLIFPRLSVTCRHRRPILEILAPFKQSLRTQSSEQALRGSEYSHWTGKRFAVCWSCDTKNSLFAPPICILMAPLQSSLTCSPISHSPTMSRIEVNVSRSRPQYKVLHLPAHYLPC